MDVEVEGSNLGEGVVIVVKTHSMGLIHYSMIITSEDILAYIVICAPLIHNIGMKNLIA